MNKTVSRRKSNRIKTLPPRMDTLSLDGSECYYDLDIFVKLVKINPKKKAEKRVTEKAVKKS